MDYWTHHIPILATELKPAGCRSYAMKRPSGIQNEKRFQVGNPLCDH